MPLFKNISRGTSNRTKKIELKRGKSNPEISQTFADVLGNITFTTGIAGPFISAETKAKIEKGLRAYRLSAPQNDYNKKW